jgi:hypothetical protein
MMPAWNPSNSHAEPSYRPGRFRGGRRVQQGQPRAGRGGRIVDADFAQESANAAAGQMLLQSSATMLKQVDGVKRLTLSLLQ